MILKEKVPILSRNFTRLWKEKTFVLLVALLLFILLSMSILISVVVFLFNPQYLTTEDVPIAILENHNLPNELFRANDIYLIEFSTLTEARLAYENNTVDAIIYEEFITQEGEPKVLELIITQDPLKQSLILSLLKPALERAEAKMQYEQNTIPNAIWHSQVRFSSNLLSGTNTIYEAILGLMIPLILVIPIFLIGNLFVDSVSQEFEEGNMENILVTISPLRYVYEHLGEALILNSILTSAFLFLIQLRFNFIENELLVFLYAQFFLIPIILLSLLITFAFKKKEVGQLIYSFTILAIFLLSPFSELGPTYVITELLLGRTALFIPGITIMIVASTLLYFALKYNLKKEYYI